MRSCYIEFLGLISHHVISELKPQWNMLQQVSCLLKFSHPSAEDNLPSSYFRLSLSSNLLFHFQQEILNYSYKNPFFYHQSITSIQITFKSILSKKNYLEKTAYEIWIAAKFLKMLQMTKIPVIIQNSCL